MVVPNTILLLKKKDHIYGIATQTDSRCIHRFLAMNATLQLQIPLCGRFLITLNEVIFLRWKLNTNLIRCHDQNIFHIKVKN